ncbi:universal stress protein [Halosimplex rubrum]|uniref:Universal stress protein n=1 Tax=Halosimplex rubrum TaxID=869889 RepID=A0A7D5P2K3_9EURY|nr:universal stress protein [Halosimplex rubrum]QLH79383.1 universal stress protein [Halosimplex rubrum]
MTYLVPFDGSALSEAALERAREFADLTDAELVALVVIPLDERDFAVERGWIDAEERYDPDEIESALEARIRAIAPEATFRCERPEDVSSVASITTDVVRTIRAVAQDVSAEIVFIGSENAGRVSTPVSSVGAPISEDPRYDVHIVHHADGG